MTARSRTSGASASWSESGQANTNQRVFLASTTNKPSRRSAENASIWRPFEALPPLAWILSTVRGASWEPPRRILVSGAVPEGFGIAKALPAAEVAILESQPELVKSIKSGLSRRRLKNASVHCGSFDDPTIGELIGGNFDLVIAPSALSSAANLEQALFQLSSCAAPAGGAIYVELPGRYHPGGRLSRLGELCRSSRSGTVSLPWVTASVCGIRAGHGSPHATSRCWPFRRWVESLEAAGLRVAGSTLGPFFLPYVVSGGGLPVVSGSDTNQVCEVLEEMAAPPVLPVVLGREAVVEPPWEIPEELETWRPVVLFFSRDKLPAMEPPWERSLQVTIDVPGLLPRHSYGLSAAILELLRRSDGDGSLRSHLQAMDVSEGLESISRVLHFLHYAAIVRLLPPEPAAGGA